MDLICPPSLLIPRRGTRSYGLTEEGKMGAEKEHPDWIKTRKWIEKNIDSKDPKKREAARKAQEALDYLAKATNSFQKGKGGKNG